MSDRSRKGLGTLVGNAGEYFVMAELLRRGWIAALAPRNAPAFDILGTRGGRTVRIRVKTRSEAKADKWQWTAKADGTVLPELRDADDDFTVLVTLPEEPRERPTYHVVPTAVVDERLRWRQAEFEKRGGSTENRHRCLILKEDADWLAECEDAWDRLWES